MAKQNKKLTGPYALYGTSEKNEKEGVVIDYGTFAIRIKRAGPSNLAFVRETRKIQEKYGRKLELNVMSDDDIRNIYFELFAKTVIVDWSGVVDEKGNEMECTPVNCIKLFTDLPDLYTDLQEQATNYETFRDTSFEETVKN